MKCIAFPLRRGMQTGRVSLLSSALWLIYFPIRHLEGILEICVRRYFFVALMQWALPPYNV